MNITEKIIITPYNPAWAIEFEKLKAVYLKVLEGLPITIEHVGSTSIKGLHAKPIIDMDIVIAPKKGVLQEVIQRIEPLGYEYVGDLGVIGREVLLRQSENAPNDGSNPSWEFHHHLYVCPEGSLGLRNHINLRDYLRKHPNEIEKYGALKQDLAQKFAYDLDAYIDGKTAFITGILKKAGMSEDETGSISDQNLLKEE